MSLLAHAPSRRVAATRGISLQTYVRPSYLPSNLRDYLYPSRFNPRAEHFMLRPVERSFLPEEVRFRHGANLPHSTANNGTYHAVFRLADSLPAHVVAALHNEREILREKLRSGRLDEKTYQTLVRRHFSERIEQILDVGYGACWMNDPRIADLVAKALAHFNGARYQLIAAAIMPNHGHAVVKPLAGYELSDILKSWKGYTARMGNQILNRSGEFWQREGYDHLIRDESDFRHSVNYVLQNPNKAGLRNWPWVWDGKCWGESPPVIDV